jgi:hypothetical protein
MQVGRQEERMAGKTRAALVVMLALAGCTGEIEGRKIGDQGGASASGGGGAAGVIGLPGTGGGAASNGGGGASGGQPTTLPEPRLRRLTISEYKSSVRDLIGVEADASALSVVPPLHGLRAIGASTVTLPPVDLEAFEQNADTWTATLFADPTARMKLVGCDGAQASCGEGFVATFGRRVFRRPLTPDESTRYLALLRTATTMTSDGWLGLRVVTSALLQSPSFLYRVEIGEPDPADPARRLLTPYELASRLSFFFWGTTPDDALLDAAQSGALATTQGIQEQAQRLLTSMRAADASRDLFADYLQLDELDTLAKLPELFPLASDALASAMKEETLRSLRTLLFEREGDFRTTFTTRTTFVNGDLAELYDVSPRMGDAFAEIELPTDGARAGLLTQASFLALHSHPGRTSPTLRGKFIRENLLCQGIAPPPPGVDTQLPDTADAKTMRERLTRHREDPTCAGCHSLTDPIGLALEHFDALGEFRQTDDGATIDASGELDGMTFGNARELGTVLSMHPGVLDCFTRTLLRFARGALEHSSEVERVSALNAAFAAAGHRVPDLMLAIASDDAFRTVGALQ